LPDAAAAYRKAALYQFRSNWVDGFFAEERMSDTSGGLILRLFSLPDKAGTRGSGLSVWG